MSFYPYHCGNSKITKKVKAYLINRFKSEQKYSTMSSPVKTAKRKIKRKTIQEVRKELPQDSYSRYWGDFPPTLS